MSNKPIVAITFREGGENGGPFISHKRVMKSCLSSKYEFVPLAVPIPKILKTREGMSEFVKRIVAIKPDLVHFAGLQLEGYFVSLALKKAGVKNSLLAIHGSSSEAIELASWKKHILKILEYATVNNTKYCFAVSEYVRSWPVCNAGHNCLGVVYNMMGADTASRDKHEVRHELSIPENAIVVVSTGRIIKEKGYDQLVTICNTLDYYGIMKRIYFIIVGDGSYLPQLKEEISSKHYSEHIKLIGYRANVHDYLNASDIYWTSTKHETLGCSIIEACSNSLPIVASNVGGIPEIVDSGIGGILIDAWDARSFADAIAELATDENKRREMGRNARAHAYAIFSDDVIAGVLDEYYQRTLK